MGVKNIVVKYSKNHTGLNPNFMVRIMQGERRLEQRLQSFINDGIF